MLIAGQEKEALGTVFNATPLYGKPSWWGDDAEDKKKTEGQLIILSIFSLEITGVFCDLSLWWSSHTTQKQRWHSSGAIVSVERLLHLSR